MLLSACACMPIQSNMCAQLVRRWRLGTLERPADGDALFCHNYPVRALASGPLGTLVSGDATGELAIWSIREPSPAKQH